MVRPKQPRGIVLYDFLQVRGGAEQVSLFLSQSLQAELCVGYVETGVLDDTEHAALKLINLHSKSRLYPATLLKTMRAFSRHNLFRDHYDWAIYSGFYAPLAILNNPAKRNLLYCHTIPRFAYDMRAWYLNRSPFWQRPGLRLFMDHVQRRYEAAIAPMDLIIANSQNVADRVQHYLQRPAEVVHPPCAIESFRWLSSGDYYLSLARLEDYKRIDLIIEAFKQMPDKQLLITSGGSAETKLRRLAEGADNITFTGWVSKARLQSLIGHAIATLYLPIDEDFGLSPVESMAAGKPVIGVAEGGLLETVIADQTGILLPPSPSAEQLIDAVNTLSRPAANAMRVSCEQRAQAFSPDVFKNKIQRLLYCSPHAGKPVCGGK